MWEDFGKALGWLWDALGWLWETSGKALGGLWDELWGLWRLWRLQGCLRGSLFIKGHHSVAVRKSAHFLFILRCVF